MKRKMYRLAVLCLMVCLCACVTLAPAFAAGTTYVLTFSPGANGSFSDSAVTYLSGFGTTQKNASGSVSVVVPEGTAFPSGILSYLTAESGYYYKSGLTGSAAAGDATYVAQYGILSGSGVSYTVEYVDSVSGASLSETYIAYANAGDVIDFTARTIPGYAVDAAAKSLTVADGAVLRFLYTSDGTLNNIQYTYGANTITYQTAATAAPTTAAAAGTTAGEQATGEAQAGETIPDNAVPQAGGQTTTQGGDNGQSSAGGGTTTEEITGEPVPQSGGQETTQNMSKGVVAALYGGGALIVAAVLAILLHKKKAGVH